MASPRQAAHTAQGRQGLRLSLLSAAVAALLITATGAQAQTGASTPRQFDIPASSMVEALDRFGEQSGLQVSYGAELLEALRSKPAPAVNGQLSPDAALEWLLQGSGLEFGYVNAKTVVIKKAPAKSKERVKRKLRGEPAAQKEVTNMPAIMVTGTKTLNMDIVRTEDDPQPYVVFDREQIERSGATSLEQFLQQRLTMNTGTVNAGDGNGSAATSQITLRGLSAAQTLILIDGHRVSSPAFSTGNSPGTLNQADITGIPLSAIERIEVLPTTASGIYGGNATGGVINIIMRRDYSGAEVKLTYDNTFSTGTAAAARTFDFTAGHNFNEGMTNLLASITYSDGGDLLVGDRGLVQDGRELIWKNNPAWFLGPLGRPPLGATPNITSADGSNLTLDNGTPLNSTFTSIPEGYFGSTSDGGAALVSNAGTYNWELADTAQSGGGKRQSLYTQPQVKSGAIVLRHQFGESLQAFVDLSASKAVSRYRISNINSIYRVLASAPNNPFSQDILISAPLDGGDSEQVTKTERQRSVIGVIKKLQGKWQVAADYTWDRTTVNFGSALTITPIFPGAVTSGAVDVLRDTSSFPVNISQYVSQSTLISPFESTMRDINVRASGPVGIFGKNATLTTFVASRNEEVPGTFSFLPAFNFAQFYPARSQSVNSTYLELRIPFISSKAKRPSLNELELQIAVRRDDYSSESGQVLSMIGELPSPLPEATRDRNDFVSIDPTIAIRWKPSKDLALRASYGTGFLPPALNQLVPSIQPFPISGGIDPLRGNSQAGPFTLITGGNPDLRPEQSRSWSGGIIISPHALPSFRMSIDYTRIKKFDNIGIHPDGFQGVINNEALFPSRIVRGQNLPGDPPGWAGPITLIDNSAMNLATTELEAWDVRLDFRKETLKYGAFDLYFMGTWQPHYKTRSHDSQPIIERAGVSFGSPLKFKANAGLVWERSGWRAGWNVSHFNEYRQIDTSVINQGSEVVPSQTYHDAFVSYDVGLAGVKEASWLTNTEIKVGVKNIFNKRPPVDVFNSFGLYSPFGSPRLSSWYLSILTRF